MQTNSSYHFLCGDGSSLLPCGPRPGRATAIYMLVHGRSRRMGYKGPALVLIPDLDSSQDSRKVSQGIFTKNPKIDEVTQGRAVTLPRCFYYDQKTNRKFLPIPNLAPNWAKSAFLN